MTQAATGHGDGAVPADQTSADAAATEPAALGPAPAETTPSDGAAPAAAPPGYAPNVAFPRGVRSFVVRAGRTTTGQARALAELGPRYILDYDRNTTDLVAAGADPAGAVGTIYSKTVLEIGFGMGQATAHIAALQPDTLFIGCEVHEPGVGALLKLIGEQKLTNIRILQHDAVAVLQDIVAPSSLN